MFTGRLFQINSSVLAIHSVGGQRTAIMIPEGAFLRVVSGPRAEDMMIDITWEGRALWVLTEDLFEHGKEVQSVRENGARA